MGLFTQKSRYWQQKLDSFTGKVPPSLSEALQLFDHLAALPHIAYHHLESGCEARTHLMCVELLRRGYLPRKAWAFDPDGRKLSFTMPNREADVWWSYHAAPVLMVNAGPAQGGIIPMIFDPALLDGPATEAVWASAMQTHARNVHVVPLGYSPPSHRGDYLPQNGRDVPDSLAFTNVLTDDHARRRMDTLRREATGEPRIVFACGLREPQYTPAWRTEGAVAPYAGPQGVKTQAPRL